MFPTGHFTTLFPVAAFSFLSSAFLAGRPPLRVHPQPTPTPMQSPSAVQSHQRFLTIPLKLSVYPSPVSWIEWEASLGTKALPYDKMLGQT